MPSHKLVITKFCPYSQRVTIGLEERQMPCEVVYIPPDDKPAWFVEISPLGKVPLLLVDEQTALFESAAITEYLEEVSGHRLHPADPVERARHRAWIAFAAGLTAETVKLALARDEQTVREKTAVLKDDLDQLDDEVAGPLFAGEAFSNVDAIFAPALQRLTWLQERAPSLALLDGAPQVAAWRDALLARPSVQRSMVPEIRRLYLGMLQKHGSWVGTGTAS